MTTIFVAGIAASTVAAHSQPAHESLADGGCGVASWEWNLPRTYGGAATRRGAPVRIVEYGHDVYRGQIDTIADGAVTCRGLWAAGETILALGPGGTATRDIGAALTQNMTRWGVTNRRGVAGVVLGDADEPVMMTNLLRQYAEQEGKYAGVDASGDVYVTSASATRWHIYAGDVDLGGSDSGTITRLAGRHRDMSGTYVTTHSDTLPGPLVEATADLTGRAGGTDRGRMSPADAKTLLNGILARMGGLPTWTTELEISQQQIRRIDGAPAALANVRGGDTARIHSLTAAQQQEYGAPYIDVVLGKVTRTIGSPIITIAPVGSDAMTLEEAMEAVA